MRFMFVVALIFSGVVACLPWINASLDEAGLKQDAAFAPELSRTSSAVTAPTVAHYQGGPMKLQGKELVPIQRVTITVDYDRPIYLGLTRKMAFTVDTEGIGDGGISSYPTPAPREPESPAEAEAPSGE